MAPAKANSKLAEEQIEHWREILVGILGPYALYMPASQIQLYRDRLQCELDGENQRYRQKRQ